TSRARFALGRGDLAAARRWAEERQLGPEDPVDFYHTTQYSTLARLLLASGRPEEAEMLLRRLLDQTEAGGRMRSPVEAAVLLSLARQAQGDTTDALALLDSALVRSRQARFVRIFADEGEPLAALLAMWLESAHARQAAPALRSYVERLLGAFTTDQDQSANL